MLRIGEFSKLTQVSIRMLRYYDETGLLPPAMVEAQTGYRYYRAEQIPQLQKIVLLRDLGYSVAEIGQALENWNDVFLAENLGKAQKRICQNIEQESERLSRIDSMLRELGTESAVMHYSFMLKKVPSYAVISLRRIIPDYFSEGQLWKELGAFVQENKVAVDEGLTTFAVYHDEDFKEKDVDVEVCAPVTEFGQGDGEICFRQTEEVAHMACAMVYGPFENIRGAYLDFAGWLSGQGSYQMGGTSRQTCHRGPWNEENPQDYLTEIQIPLKKKG